MKRARAGDFSHKPPRPHWEDAQNFAGPRGPVLPFHRRSFRGGFFREALGGFNDFGFGFRGTACLVELGRNSKVSG